MPFAKSARVEFEVGDRPQSVYCQVDWHRYPDQPLAETDLQAARRALCRLAGVTSP